MSRKFKKIQSKVEEVYYKSFDEVLQIQAVLKCLECACYYYEDELKTGEIRLIITLIQQKMEIINNSIDKLSLI